MNNLIVLFLILLMFLCMIKNTEGHTIIPNQELDEHLDELGFEKDEGNIILDNLDAQDVADLADIAIRARTYPDGVSEGVLAAFEWGFEVVGGHDGSDTQGIVDFISEDHSCQPSYAEGCRVSLKDNTRISRHARDLFNVGFANFSEYSMIPEAYIVGNSSICDSGSHCGSDGKPHADVIQFILNMADQRFKDQQNLWKEHHDICYKDWAVACDNAGWACKPYINGVPIENPETHNYNNPGEFKCYHRSIGSGWLPPGDVRCDDWDTACPYEHQCRTYSDKFPRDCEGHIDKTDPSDFYHYRRASQTTQDALCSRYDNNERGCINHNTDRASNDIEYHNVFGDLWEIIEHIKNLN